MRSEPRSMWGFCFGTSLLLEFDLQGEPKMNRRHLAAPFPNFGTNLYPHTPCQIYCKRDDVGSSIDLGWTSKSLNLHLGVIPGVSDS